MRVLRSATSVGVGNARNPESAGFSKNHFAATPLEIQHKIASMGLLRVAGSVYECPSTMDFWKVTSDGGIRRLSGDEVDNGESIPAAPKDHPSEFLASILEDMEF